MKKRAGELVLPNATPDKPDWLNAEASKMWDRLTTDPRYSQAIAALDGYMLAVLCQEHGRYVEAQREGKVIGTKQVMMVQGLASHFGLMPTDRVKLGLAATEPKVNKFAALGA